MKLCRAISVLLLMSYNGSVGAALEFQYLSSSVEATAVGGIYIDRRAWELRDSLGEFLNYRIAAYDQSGFRLGNEGLAFYNLKNDGRGISTVLDLHPFRGRFRISAGAVLYTESLEYIAAPSINHLYELQVKSQRVTSDLSGQDVVVSRRLEINSGDIGGHVNIHYARLAPYFGMGWSNRFDSQSRLYYSFDIGLLFQGDPDIDLHLSGSALQIHPEMTARANQWVYEEEFELREKLEKYSVARRLALGVSYRFD